MQLLLVSGRVRSFTAYSFALQYLKDPDITISYVFLVGKVIPEKVGLTIIIISSISIATA